MLWHFKRIEGVLNPETGILEREETKHTTPECGQFSLPRVHLILLIRHYILPLDVEGAICRERDVIHFLANTHNKYLIIRHSDDVTIEPFKGCPG